METSKKPATGTTHRTKLELSAEVLIEDRFGEWAAYKMPIIRLLPGEKLFGEFDGEAFKFDLIRAPSVAQAPSLEN
jgi:hypothetical protein